MNAAPPPMTAPKTERLVSLDIFRGLVIVVMTIVNFLSPVHGVPAWLKHRPEALEGYTLADVVFPAFLFIVGVAIPFSLQRRLDRGDSIVSLIGKIIVRSAALVFLGVVTVNHSIYSESASFLTKPLWFLLTMLSVVAIWQVCPSDASPCRKRIHRMIQIGGVICLAVLLCLFRGKDESGQIVWLQSLWWGMLGYIGWAYLVAGLCWLIFRNNTTALAGAMWLMIIFYIADRHGAFAWTGIREAEPFSIGYLFGTNPATVMVGVIVGAMLQSGKARACVLLAFGACLYTAGSLLRPLHGINKTAHTDAYALVAGGICCALFAATYYIVDVRHWKKWGTAVIPIGQNALLAYILPDMMKDVFALFGRDVYWSREAPSGAFSAALLTAVILVIVYLLTRLRVILRF